MNTTARLLFCCVLLGLLGDAPPSAATNAAANTDSAVMVPVGETVERPEELVGLSSAPIEQLAFSPDDQSVALGLRNGKVCVFDLTQKRLVSCKSRTDGHQQTAAPTSLAWSKDGNWLAAGYQDGYVQTWPRSEQRMDLRLPPCSKLAPVADANALGRAISWLQFGKSNMLSALASRSGNVLGCGGDQHQSEATANINVKQLAGFPSTFFDRAAVNRSGDLAAIAKEHHLAVFDLPSGAQRWPVTQSRSLITAVAMTADGSAVAAGHFDGEVVLIFGPKGKPISLRAAKREAGESIRGLAFTPDGHSLIVGTEAGQLIVCSPSAGTCDAKSKVTIAGHAPLKVLTVSADGTRVLVPGDSGSLVQLSLPMGTIQKFVPLQAASVTSLALLKGSHDVLLAAGASDGTLRTFERAAAPGKGAAWAQRCQVTIGEGQPITKLIAKQDSNDTAVLMARSGTVLLMDSASCEPRITLDVDEQKKEHAQEAAFSRDGRWLAVGTPKGFIQVWEHQGGEWRPLPRLTAHSDEIRSLTFVGSGENIRLVSGSLDKQVFEWELPSGKQMHSYPALRQGPRALTSRDADSLLAMAAGTEISLWDYKSHTQIGQPLQAKQPVLALQLVPGSTLLMASLVNGEVQTWDLATRAEQAPLNPKESGTQTSSLAVLQDGPQPIVASTAGSKVFLWNVATKQPLGQLWQGGKSWAYLDLQGGKATLFRYDFGNLVWQNLNGNLTPFPPPKTNAVLEVTGYQSTPAAQTEPLLLGRYTVEFMNNSSAEQASWVELLPQEYSGRNDLRDLVRIQVDDPQPNVLRMGPDASSTVRFSLYQSHGTLLPPREVKFCLSAKHYHSPPRKPVSHDCAEREYPFVAKFEPWWWQYLKALAAGLAVVAMTLIGWLRWRSYREVTGSVVIQQLLAGTSALRQVGLYELPAIEQLLRSARFFPALNDKIKSALVNARIDPHGWQRALRATRSAPACAAAIQACLAPQLRARLSTRFECDGLATFALSLPPLSLQFPQSCLLIICTSRSQTAQATVSQCSRAELGAPRFALLLDLTRSGIPQDPRAIRAALLESHPGTIFVVLGAAQATEILLSRDHQEAQGILCRVIVPQCELYQIIPYHAGGHGISTEEQSLFFGRKAELQQLLHFYKRNFLLAGPRSMGKSSLLNALAVELAHRHPEVLVVSHLLYDGSLEDKTHPWLRTETPTAFYNSVVQHPAPFIVFLYDEADEFLTEDEKADYAYCAVMRALSGDGRASFVLTGNSEVVRAVQTPDHPLSNFGILLRLEPLDQESAQQMILQPAAALGLRYSEPEQIVHWLCEQTGCRPHLLASACIAFITALFPRRDQPIKLADIQQRILRAEFLEQAFERWNHATIAPLDCTVASLILKLHEPRPEDILRHLQADGSAVTAHELEQCLFRLYTWHYVADTNKHGRLYCPVPLFRFWLSEDRRSSLPPIAVESLEPRNLTAP